MNLKDMSVTQLLMIGNACNSATIGNSIDISHV